LLELLKHKKIAIGTKITVVQKFSFDHSLDIKIEKQVPFTISQQLAQTLMVKVIEQKSV
jgi:DtxR family Mn-dependent transcriptional regulator